MTDSEYSAYRKHLMSVQDKLYLSFKEIVEKIPEPMLEHKYKNMIEVGHKEKDNIFGAGFLNGFNFGYALCFESHDTYPKQSESFKVLSEKVKNGIDTLLDSMPESTRKAIQLFLSTQSPSILKSDVMHIIFLSIIGASFIEANTLIKVAESVGVNLGDLYKEKFPNEFTKP